MQLHFGQLPTAKGGQKKAAEVPMLPPWMIEQIKKRKPLEDRQQPRVEIDDRPPPDYEPPQREPPEGRRGVEIIQL